LARARPLRPRDRCPAQAVARLVLWWSTPTSAPPSSLVALATSDEQPRDERSRCREWKRVLACLLRCTGCGRSCSVRSRGLGLAEQLIPLLKDRCLRFLDLVLCLCLYVGLLGEARHRVTHLMA